jgi:ATP-dependent Lon protease
MKHNIDELFGDGGPLSRLANKDFDMSKIHMEAISVNADDMEVQGPVPDELPILVIRDAVLFPDVTLPVQVTRKASKRLVADARRNHLAIGVVAQRGDAEFPEQKDLMKQGCMAHVVNVTKVSEDELIAIISGGPRFNLDRVVRIEPYMVAQVSTAMPEDTEKFGGAIHYSMLTALKNKFRDVMSSSSNHLMPSDNLLSAIRNDRLVVNTMAAHAPLETQQKQTLLEATTLDDRAQQLLTYLTVAQEAVQIEKDVDDKVHKMMDKQQKEYFLNQQLHAIQEELGGTPYDKEMDDMELQAGSKKWPAEVADHFSREMQKLRRIPPQQPDFFVQQSYLQFMLDLPWNVTSKDNLKVRHAKRVLDADHYGLEKIKERIVEYIATMSLKRDLKAPILCLVGPPGTGKTSLGKSIANALGRKYVRMALGGVHDESEIRGHRRTYVGAMAGRVLQSIKRAGVSNPVIVLDEIDKVQSNSFNGDPTAALLEVLDPEQNVAFHDNYLDQNYDLSKVLFIATANSTATIQPALLDRMEVIELSGYMLEEKVEIAKRHLIPRLLEAHGVSDLDVHFLDSTVKRVIDEYTHESGVRQLEQQLAACVRKRCVEIAKQDPTERLGKNDVHITDLASTIRPTELQDMLGLPIHQLDKRNKEDMVGVVTGLAWTQNGGVILFVESSVSKGEGKLSMTGNLGNVMKESATLAFEYLKANAEELGIDSETIEKSNIHIHCPEGATPKDGPSAGITIFTAMVSAFTHRKVRRDVAMTGEITLRGAVTPIGGVKEKILAAKRAGCTDLVLCEDNRRDVEDIAKKYLDGLSFHYINEVKEVLPLALA